MYRSTALAVISLKAYSMRAKKMSNSEVFTTIMRSILQQGQSKSSWRALKEILKLRNKKRNLSRLRSRPKALTKTSTFWMLEKTQSRSGRSTWNGIRWSALVMSYHLCMPQRDIRISLTTLTKRVKTPALSWAKNLIFLRFYKINALVKTILCTKLLHLTPKRRIVWKNSRRRQRVRATCQEVKFLPHFTIKS